MGWFCTVRSQCAHHCRPSILPREELQIIVLSHYKCYDGQKQARIMKEYVTFVLVERLYIYSVLKRATTNGHNVRQRPNIADIFMCVDLQCFVTAEVESRISNEETKFHDLLRSTRMDLKRALWILKRAHVRPTYVRTKGELESTCVCVSSVSMCGRV